MKFLICFCIALISFVAMADAKLYKWVDADGRVCYSDSPPDDGREHQEIENKNSSNERTSKAKSENIESKNTGSRTDQYLINQIEKKNEEESRLKTSRKCELLARNIEMRRRELHRARKTLSVYTVNLYRQDLQVALDEYADKCKY